MINHCLRTANAMNEGTMINISNSDNSNIARNVWRIVHQNVNVDCVYYVYRYVDCVFKSKDCSVYWKVLYNIFYNIFNISRLIMYFVVYFLVPRVHVYILASLHPHILRFMCAYLYFCILTSLYLRLHVCLLTSTHPWILIF